MRDGSHLDDLFIEVKATQDMNIYDFLMLGLGEVAYVKRETNKVGGQFLVCESDGTKIGQVDELGSATSMAHEKRLRLLQVN